MSPIFLPHVLLTCGIKWENASWELSTWDFQVEEVRGSNISLKLLWLQLLKLPWKFVFDAHRIHGTKTVYLPYFTYISKFHKLPHKNQLNIPLWPRSKGGETPTQQVLGFNFRNRLAKLEQALRNKDEPGDPRFGIGIEWGCFWQTSLEV